ncbi:hypothetical protein [Bradyrhizobium sp. CCGE-LA001]|uniref:hypothetical protein n=1 Tax=Bradyrhizobium sp. CCGE-LA001 TaxID=1223566 RepID=UPI0002AAB691|nr:hypothetical protein [Bradyrhizobium sp. CCGE-LA001]AMA57369.1 hypothetical protein BCCGELA001_14615 [Bradyrhizobium sp. CCGE-LA001]
MIDQSFLDDQRELLGAAQIDKLHHLLDETSARLIDDIHQGVRDRRSQAAGTIRAALKRPAGRAKDQSHDASPFFSRSPGRQCVSGRADALPKGSTSFVRDLSAFAVTSPKF